MRIARLGVFLLCALPGMAFGQPSDIPVIHYKAVPEWPKPLTGDQAQPKPQAGNASGAASAAEG